MHSGTSCVSRKKKTLLQFYVFGNTVLHNTYTHFQITCFGLHSSHHQTYLLSRTIQCNVFLILGSRSHSFTVYGMKHNDYVIQAYTIVSCVMYIKIYIMLQLYIIHFLQFSMLVLYNHCQ